MGSAFRVPFVVRYAAVLFVLFFMVVPQSAFAGFGISPPYVYNDRLTRGTVYQQKITLVRSDPIDDLKAEITMNIPGIESWFSVDRGTEFIIPKGTTQMPIIISVRVPDDAEYKQYKGGIRIRTSSAEVKPGGGVSIALGAQVDVDIKVVDKIYDFEVRKAHNEPAEEGRRRWGLFFPGKIKFFMTVENTGNTDYGPTKVQFDIYDNQMETLLETVYNTNKIDTVGPFATQEVMAELPVHLPVGRYQVKYTIYKGDDVAKQNTLVQTVAAIGSIAGYSGYGFEGLSLQDKFKVAAALGIPTVLVLSLLGYVSLRGRRTRRHRMSRVPRV